MKEQGLTDLLEKLNKLVEQKKDLEEKYAAVENGSNEETASPTTTKIAQQLKALETKINATANEYVLYIINNKIPLIDIEAPKEDLPAAWSKKDNGQKSQKT